MSGRKINSPSKLYDIYNFEKYFSATRMFSHFIFLTLSVVSLLKFVCFKKKKLRSLPTLNFLKKVTISSLYLFHYY